MLSKKTTADKQELVRQALHILVSTDKTPAEKAAEIVKVPGFGVATASGLVMLFHPNDFAVYNKQSIGAFQKLALATGTIVEFQTDIRGLRDRLGAEDYLELDQFLYLFNQRMIPPMCPAQLAEATMKALLEQFGQLIIYGPPGTGKTREAKRVALALLAGESSVTSLSNEEVEDKLKPLREAGRFDLVVFHPAYEYEQFVGGIEPVVTGGQLAFAVKPGVFLRLCWEAEKLQGSAVLIIDEINRGNLPKLLGELVYALEYRGHAVRLPFVCEGRSSLIVPKNLYIIATMNSADRSIGHIDVAIRRRFGLYHLGPDSEVVKEVWNTAGEAAYGVKLAALMNQVNDKLRDSSDSSADVELAVGHSYFLPAPAASGDAAKKQVSRKWDHQVRPLLREYAQLLNLVGDSLQAFFQPLDKILAQP
jgi:MoxR-like ATPase